MATEDTDFNPQLHRNRQAATVHPGDIQGEVHFQDESLEFDTDHLGPLVIEIKSNRIYLDLDHCRYSTGLGISYAQWINPSFIHHLDSQQTLQIRRKGKQIQFSPDAGRTWQVLKPSETALWWR